MVQLCDDRPAYDLHQKHQIMVYMVLIDLTMSLEFVAGLISNGPLI